MKYVQKTFLDESFMCAPSFLVCACLMTCARAHAHSLDGTLTLIDLFTDRKLVYRVLCVCWHSKRSS